MPLRDDLLAPIPGPNPSGVNLRYDAITDAIKEGRREEVDAPQGEWKTAIKAADYAQVVKLAGEALAKRSKDLQIAVWLVDAHVRRESFSALGSGFDLLRNLLDGFWDTLYPEIEDGDLEVRAAPLDWLGSKLESPLVLLPITANGLSWADYKSSRAIGYAQDATTDEKKRLRQQAINDHKPTAEDFDEAVVATSRAFYENLQASVTQALESLKALADFCDEKFGEFAPSFVKTRTTLEGIAQRVRLFLAKKGGVTVAASVPVSIPSVEPAATPVEPAPAPVVPAPVAAAPVVQPVSVGYEPTGLDDVIQRVATVSKYLREKTIYDAGAYLILRALRWGELRAKAPEINPAMLDAPPTELRDELNTSFLAAQWDQVLNATERAMELPCGRAWLDLQRYTVIALENKGEYFAGVGRAVKLALRSLLEELPDLLNQTMTDDSPVAHAETATWIREQVLSPSTADPWQAAATPEIRPQTNAWGLPAAEPVEEIAPEPPKMEAKPPQIEPEQESTLVDEFDEALAAAEASRGAEALDMISKRLATEQSGRGRFRRRVQLAHLLMAGGHQRIALPILEELTAEIEERKLEDWERGDALAYPFELLLRCLNSNGAEPSDRRKFYSRLCRLDPVRALKWEDC
jgi:type VI secretion system protein ImpA